jgi:hypothetical protein
MVKANNSKKSSKKIGFSGKEDRFYIYDDLSYVINQIEKINIEKLSTALRLTSDGKRAFAIFMNHIAADIKSIHETEHKLSSRDEKIERLKNLRKALEKVNYECLRSASHINDIVPEVARAKIGKWLTFSASSEILNKSMFPVNDDMRLQSITEDGKTLTVKIVEDEFQKKREAIGLNHGGDLFSTIIKIVNDVLIDWAELHAEKNTNNKNIRYARNHIVERVLESASSILGPERAAMRGESTRLCRVILEACGVHLDGLAATIARTKMRAS